jgi:hypothetical protein
MIQLNSSKLAENMFCLEFDLEKYPLETQNGEPIELHQKFRKIDQKFTESILSLKLSGNCHGQKVFGPNDLTINL